jgi:hypothetical protein
VERLSRDLSDPNLHDIANLNFRVELWDRYAHHWVISASLSVTVAHAALTRQLRTTPVSGSRSAMA